MDGMKGIEPPAGLVHAFCDEIGGAAEIGGVEPAQAGLGIRHGSGIEPYVDEVAFAHHLLSGRADEEDIVHIRPVKVD